MQIMSYGDTVKVIKPASLAKVVKDMHKRATERY